MSERLLNRIIGHEGFRQFPYFDCCGKPFRQCQCKPQGVLTAGHGRNLENVGIRHEESVHLAQNDIRIAKQSAYRLVKDFPLIDEVRREVIIEMIYNMGPLRFMSFKKMLAAVSKRDFEEAAREMVTSRWATQVKGRAIALAEAMRTGKFAD